MARNLAAALFLFAAAVPLTGCVYAPLDLGLNDLGKLQEITLVDADTDDKVLLVRIDGEITDEPGSDGLFASREGTVSAVKDVLDVARDRRDVKALILRINSPGGGVTASDVIYHELTVWRQTTRKPIVALFMDVAASGGYYVAQAADKIVAHPTATTGSIGVIAMLPNVSGLAAKLGVSMDVIKSGAHKDMGSPFRAMTPDDEALFQKLIDDTYAQFVGVVATGRKKAGLSVEEIRKLADGRIYTAQDAKKYKLIDDVGYFEDALKAATALAGIKDAKVVTYDRKGFGAGRHTIYSHASDESIDAAGPRHPTTSETNIVKIDAPGLSGRPRPVMYYLWEPGLR